VKSDRFVHLSKLLSLTLRHEPGRMGLALDTAGWVAVDAVLRGFAENGTPMTRDELEAIVRSSDKQRFALSDDGVRIRANQGHSVEVELGYEPASPPPLLFHGTVHRFLASIRERGLVRGQRHHVHLSATADTASRVGQRRGRPVVLRIQAAAMAQRGHEFFLAANGVWLAEFVPVDYILFPEDDP
jgi:putative RNA 2'-phosphotransferase